MSTALVRSEGPEAMLATDIEAGINRPYPANLLVICVLCEHLYDDHAYGVLQPTACYCCRTLFAGGHSTLPARFARRTKIYVELRSGEEWQVRRSIALVGDPIRD